VYDVEVCLKVLVVVVVTVGLYVVEVRVIVVNWIAVWL
jgi:hypothetical protein